MKAHEKFIFRNLLGIIKNFYLIKYTRSRIETSEHKEGVRITKKLNEIIAGKRQSDRTGGLCIKKITARI